MPGPQDTTRPSQPSLRLRLARGVAWNLAGVGFNQGSTFVVNVVLAHVLGVSVFGKYALVLSTVSVTTLLAQLATGYTATKYVAEFRTSDPSRAGRILGLLATVAVAMAALASVGLVACAGWLATEMLHASDLTAMIALAAASVFFNVVNGFLMGSLAGFESFRLLGLAGIASGLIYAAAGIIGATLDGLAGAVVGMGVSGLLQAGILWTCLRLEATRQHVALGWRLDRAESGIIFKFAVPAALGGFVSMPALWLANAFLARQDGGQTLFALFTAANSFRIIVTFLPNIVNNVSMSLLNNQMGLRDNQRFQRVFWLNLAATAGSVLAGAVTIALAGRWLLGWFGPGFDRAYPTLLVLMAVTLPETTALAFFQVIQSRERLWWSVAGVAIPCFASLIAVAWWLTPQYGPLGLALAHLTGWTVAAIASVLVVSKLGIRLSGASPVAARA